MGLLSSMRNAVAGRNEHEDTARALLAMPLLVSASDGKIDAAELHQITNMCAFNPIFHVVGAARTQDIAKSILTDLQKQGAEAVFKGAKAGMTPKLAETALCFAIRTALADGTLSDQEKQMLVTMGERLGVPVETFMKIFDVMVMLQRAAA